MHANLARNRLIHALIAICVFFLMQSTVFAQTTNNHEEQALSIEKQLLCPQCTNERLDICSIQICIDMRKEIREQLQNGRNSDEIIFYFQNRYGQRVLADLPRSGFNIVLFGWVLTSIALVTLGGGYTLFRLNQKTNIDRN
ncbi:MAG: cytochrome c-type biogenesis protein CcmH [Dehalococcoidia bacterium]